MGGITEVVYTNLFEREAKHLKDRVVMARLNKLVEKIKIDPTIGKPLRFALKGERTVYLRPYRLIYAVNGNTLFLLRFEHRKDVYER